MFSHRFASICIELPGDGVFGDIRAGAVPGVQHGDLALDHLHHSSGDLHRLSVTWKNNRELSGTVECFNGEFCPICHGGFSHFVVLMEEDSRGTQERYKEKTDLQLTGWPITRTRQLNLDQLIPTVRVHLCLQLESWSEMPHKHE